MEGKPARVDVNVIFNDGEVADLEMQVYKTTDNLKARAQLYTAMLLSAQSREGEKYDDIKCVYQIFFLDCVIFPGSEKIPRRYSYREETEYDRLSDTTEIIFYEMPKLERKVRDMIGRIGEVKTKDLSEEEKWCIFMRYHHEKRAAELVEKLYREEESIMLAQKAVNGISRDYLEYIRQMAETKDRLAVGQRLYEAEQEGMEKGKAERNLEIAQKMKAAGRPLAEIVEFTGLSLETIQQKT
jgi:predicted transposase/invertase (TIGR01784 family)